MEDNKRYYWLKLYDDLFTSKRIKKLRKLSSDFFIIYLKLQLLSLNDGGKLTYTGIEESFASELALDIEEDPDKIQMTLAFLQSCGLLEVVDNELILPYVEKCTGSETQSTRRSRKCRKNKALDQKKDKKALQCNDNATEMQRNCNVEIDKERKLELKQDLDSETRLTQKNNIIILWKTITNKIVNQRNQYIDKSLNEYGYDYVVESINKLSMSNYLLGKTEHGFIIHYHWFYNHIIDIHDGVYDSFEKKPKKNKSIIDYDELENEFLTNK